MPDAYTPAVLKQMYTAHKAYVLSLKTVLANTGLKVRMPNMPEHISENIAKMIIWRTGDPSSTWDCTKGDLLSTKEGKQEIKCFTSDGPPSFTPSSNWDVIYFLDARNWLESDRFVLHRVALKRTSDEWKAIKVNATQCFNDQCVAGRRPRITWNMLYPQIATHTTTVFDGKFDEIF